MSLTTSYVGSGVGWEAVDYVCTAGPEARPFEERHANFAIVLVTEGRFQYRSSTGRAVPAAGGLVLGNAAEAYECGHAYCNGDRCLAFRYAPALLDSILGAVPGARRLRFQVPSLPPLQRFTAVMVAAEVARDAADVLALEQVAVELAGLALGTLAETTPAPADPSRRDIARISAAQQRIEAESDQPLSVAELARGVAMSPYHFLRTFRKVTGATPHQYLLRARLRRAAGLLARSKDPVTTIAFDCGFNDLSTFNRYFRRMAGASPTAYRAKFVAPV